MDIQPINTVQFQSNKKFRLPIKFETYDRFGSGLFNFRTLPGRYVKEYSNPNAESLYKQALQTTDWKERVRLYREMGQYRVINVSLRERIMDYFNKLFLKSFLNN